MQDPQNIPMFRIDVSASAGEQPPEMDPDAVMITLLRQMVAAQQQQTKAIEELNQNLSAAQRQRATELGQWRDANPHLAKACRMAAETLSRVQTRFLETLTEEVMDNEDCLMDGEFMMNEFVDRFGPRMAHLNGVLQVLSQLSTIPSNSSQS